MPADPVSLVTWISVSPDFLTWISCAGETVPTPIKGEFNSVPHVTIPAEIISPTFNSSEPVPILPSDSLLTNSHHWPACAKYALPSEWTCANAPW